MNSKKWIKVFLLLSFLGVGFVGGVNYLVDPYQQYRVKTFYPIWFANERYQNGGFAKNFEYDSVILGTSMTENFTINEVEKELNLNKVLKLCVSGGSAREQSITIKTAINNNKNLKNLVWGLDTFAFIGNPNRLRFGTFPSYLYDNNIFNDYQYILSLDAAKDSAKAILYQFVKPKNDPHFNYNTMYQWQQNVKNQFTLKHLLKDWKKRAKISSLEQDKQSVEFLINNFDINFLDILKNNPKINMKIFFPPYSILGYKMFEERNQLEDILKFKLYVYNITLKYPNIKLYDFQSAKEITHNLSNYKDLLHYHQRVNSWMLVQMKNNNYLVTKQNIDQHLKNLEEQIKNYDLNKTLLED